MKMHIKHEVAKEVLKRYLKAEKEERTEILDEFSKLTGYHRKSVIRKLKGLQMTSHYKDSVAGKHKRNRERRYDGYVEAVVEQIYKALGGIGARRIHPLIKTILEKGIKFGHIKTDAITEMKVLAMSKSTLDRMVTRVRARNAIKGISTTRPGILLKNEIPLRVGVWEETDPGFSEIDCVAHCGDNAGGMFVSTLNSTDIATQWFEAEPVMGKAQERILAGLEEIKNRLPFTLAGIDSDNGSEFINHQLYGYCKENKIVFTRSRPYKKIVDHYDCILISSSHQRNVLKRNASVLGLRRYTTKQRLHMRECLLIPRCHRMQKRH